MAVSIVLDIVVTGDGPTERSLREGLAWFKTRQHTSAYHELIAQVLMFDARLHWRDADTYRRLEIQRDERQRQAAARREARTHD
jgi:hypothetical protein